MTRECKFCGWEWDKTPEQQRYVKTYEGEELDLFETTDKLAILLLHGILMANPGHPNMDKDPRWLFVICSDTFAWGLADAEPINSDDIDELYDWWVQDPFYASDKWAMKSRNMKPQGPLEDKMKDNGSWEDWIDELPDNPTSRRI